MLSDGLTSEFLTSFDVLPFLVDASVLRDTSPNQERARSSSTQDRALSRHKQRFESAWGHLLHGYMHEESPLLVKNPIRLADCHGRLSIDHGINYLGSLRYLPAIGSAKLDTCVV